MDHALRRCHFEGIDPFTPHDLRRTMATTLGELGFNRLIQDKILNHIDRSVGGVYDRHSYDKGKRQAMEAWDRRLQEILTGQPVDNVVTLQKVSMSIIGEHLIYPTEGFYHPVNSHQRFR